MWRLGFVVFLLILSYIAHAKETIYVYNDEGVAPNSTPETISMLKEFSSGYYVEAISAKQILESDWEKNAVLFVMPAGADLPYAKKLNGPGNYKIKNFVKNGGSYLGICAGSYYGSSYVEFDKGGELEVIGKRELAFFKGKAIGPVLSPYNYKNYSGARAAQISTKAGNIFLYYNGGGYFENAKNQKNVRVIGFYESKLPAIIHVKYGEGNVVLSGVHFEWAADKMDNKDGYLAKIIPDITSTEAKRQDLIKIILQQLKVRAQ